METIYLDNASTTKISASALGVLTECSAEFYANPSSVHPEGGRAAAKTEEARETIASLINASPSEIYFTSGATESDNIAIAGFARKNVSASRRILTSPLEHPAVLNTCRALEAEGFETEYLRANSDGTTSLGDIEEALIKKPLLLSLMHANNETGVINDIESAGDLCAKYGVVFHTDATQSFTKLDIDVKKMNIDMLSASAHKFHGPKGVGFLYVKKSLKLSPVMYGGGQERGLRSGTVSAPLIAAMAQAAKESCEENKKSEAYVKSLRDGFVAEILSSLKDVRINGDTKNRLNDNVNLSFAGVRDDALLFSLASRGLCVSGGSACSAGTVGPSHVLEAMGTASYGASLRVTFSRYSTHEEAAKAAQIIIEEVTRLRAE